MSGFGAPPAGGGGGFGAPPSGGGGFGAPPSGGGGFGAPPSGGGAPPGGGGEGPLAHIPFSKDDEANLSGMARFAKLAGVAAIISAVIQSTAQIVQGLVVDTSAAQQLSPAATATVQACFGVVGLAITGALAFFLFKAAAATQKVVATDDADQVNLVEALNAMKIYFMAKGILIILVIVLFCCAFSLIAFGAGAAGAAAAGGGGF